MSDGVLSRTTPIETIA